jgi:hypothetical protein
VLTTQYVAPSVWSTHHVQPRTVCSRARSAGRRSCARSCGRENGRVRPVGHLHTPVLVAEAGMSDGPRGASSRVDPVGADRHLAVDPTRSARSRRHHQREVDSSRVSRRSRARRSRPDDVRGSRCGVWSTGAEASVPWNVWPTTTSASRRSRARGSSASPSDVRGAEQRRHLLARPPAPAAAVEVDPACGSSRARARSAAAVRRRQHR